MSALRCFAPGYLLPVMKAPAFLRGFTERRKEKRRLRALDEQNYAKVHGLLRDSGYVYEKELFLVPQLLTTGATVFDIGANDGIYAWNLSRLVGPTGVVVSVEPGRRAFQALKRLVREEGLNSVRLHRAAVGESSGKANLYVPDYTKTAQIDCNGHIEGPRETVEMLTVDELARRHKISSLALLKADVEGAELLVLLGAQRTLKEFTPHLILELADVHLVKFQTTGDEILRHLWALGYQSFEFGPVTRKLHPAKRVTLKGGHTWSRLDEDLSTNNYIFVHREKVAAVTHLISAPAEHVGAA
jgi:FkbM family methyltransferase